MGTNKNSNTPQEVGGSLARKNVEYVRTRGEYASGHVKGSVNIPLNDLSSSVNKIKKNVPIITCCASGMRSASAKSTLSSLGFKEVYNGGGWMSLNGKV